MKSLLIICFVLMAYCTYAQDTTAPATHTIDSFTSVQQEARFPGGQNAWVTFLQENIHANVAAKHKAPPGNYTVIISFLVDKDGKISNVQIIDDPGYGTAEDVLKAFKHTPDWIPATQNGKKVIYRQKQRITYQVTTE